MSSNYPLIAVAVAAAVGSGYADAALPTFTQAANPHVKLVIAGSSAAAPAIANFVENHVCGSSSNTLLVTSIGGTNNFLAYSCIVPAEIDDPIGSGARIPANSIVTIYYRTEGGSVVGALPIVTGAQIKRLNLADSTCTGSGLTATCTVNGEIYTSLLTDTFSQAVAKDIVQLGITDVEPAQFTGASYPSNYATSAFGSASASQMEGLFGLPLMQQVFALVINTLNQGFSSVNISKEAAANILNGTYTNWSSVPDVNGNPVASASHAITRINREPGSGVRTSTAIYFLNYHCGSLNAIPPRAGETVKFSTGDELTAMQFTPGAIGYTSIDNLILPGTSSKYPNVVMVKINGVTPSNKAAASGQYDFWYETTLVPNPGVGATTQTATLSNFIAVNLPDINSVPARPDVNAIPFAGLASENFPHLPLPTNGQIGTATVYISPFTRGGDSCLIPVAMN